MEKLTDSDIAERLASLNGWSLNEQRIEKVFEFADFTAALDFMNRLAPTAEELGHHPDWSNSYNTVKISLTTHDVGGLSGTDFLFASAADDVASQTAE